MNYKTENNILVNITEVFLGSLKFGIKAEHILEYWIPLKV